MEEGGRDWIRERMKAPIIITINRWRIRSLHRMKTLNLKSKAMRMRLRVRWKKEREWMLWTLWPFQQHQKMRKELGQSQCRWGIQQMESTVNIMPDIQRMERVSR